MAHKSLQYQVLAEQLDISYDDVDVFLHGIYMEGMLSIFLRQLRALDDLHLMNLQDVERQAGDDGSLAQTLLGILAWQSDDDVPPVRMPR